MKKTPNNIHVLWSAEFRYRAFHAPDLRVTTLVSSNTQDSVQGVTIGDILLLVHDSSGAFCDMELAMESDKRRTIQPPGDFESSAVKISVSLQREAEVAWDTDGELLHIAVTGRATDHYVKLEGSSLVFGFSASHELSLLTISHVIADPTGLAEAAWLDELGMPR